MYGAFEEFNKRVEQDRARAQMLSDESEIELKRHALGNGIIAGLIAACSMGIIGAVVFGWLGLTWLAGGIVGCALVSIPKYKEVRKLEDNYMKRWYS